MQNKYKTKKVFHGALFLTFAGLISKVLSSLYRIPLQNLTGDMGFYIYQQVYPIIGIVMILGLYGFPAAISRLAAERAQKMQSVDLKTFYRPILMILMCFCTAIAVTLFIFSGYISRMIGDPSLQKTYQLAALMFMILPFIGLLRGVTQGRHDMLPTAYSQVTEQVVRVSIIIVGAYLIYQGHMVSSQVGYIGVLASIVGMLIAIFSLIWMLKKQPTPHISTPSKITWGYYIKSVFYFGIIASVTHMILLLMQLADVFTLVPGLIKYGLQPEQAMQTKGVFDRGQTLIQFGVVFGSSFALALVPSAMRVKSVFVTSVRDALLVSFYLTSAATVGLILLMPSVNALLYLNTKGTISLQILMFAIVLSGTVITASSVLQNLGHIYAVVLHIVVAFLLKYLLNIVLVPAFHINGSALATVLSLLYLVIMILWILHRREKGIAFIQSIRFQPFVYAMLMMCVALVVMQYVFLPNLSLPRWGLALYVGVMVFGGGVIYLSCLLRYKVFTEKQLQMLPFSRFLLILEAIVKKK